MDYEADGIRSTGRSKKTNLKPRFHKEVPLFSEMPNNRQRSSAALL